MRGLILMGVAIVIMWTLEIVTLVRLFIKEYRKDIKRHGRKTTRKLWWGRWK